LLDDEEMDEVIQEVAVGREWGCGGAGAGKGKFG